jgi:hypothetical protein
MNTSTTVKEIYRIDPFPQLGKCYEIGEWTDEKNEQYFTTEALESIGQLVETYSLGYKKEWWWVFTFKDNANKIYKIEFKYNNKMCWREVADTKTNRIEVFRLSPQKGKYYEHAEYTEHFGVWPHAHYFTTNPLRYVGKHIDHRCEGMGDGASHWDLFEDDDGTLIRIDSLYEGTTCFREIEKP